MGETIAITVFGMFLTGSSAAYAEDPKEKTTGVKCAGINGCKGQSGCASANNACKGQNSCKGEGWAVAASEKDCKAKGGKVMSDADKKKPEKPDTEK